MSTPTLAWHFVSDKLRDGRPIPADGVEMIHDGRIVICESGLHASRKIIDALRYAPGDTVCRVEMRSVFEEQDDKLVAASRTILWRTDAKLVLREFARRCASDVLHLWDAPEVVREYLRTGDPSLRAVSEKAAWEKAAWEKTAALAAALAARAAALEAALAAAAAAAAARAAAARAAALEAALAAAAAARAARAAAKDKYDGWLVEMIEAARGAQ
jgi:hypothetical protein